MFVCIANLNGLFILLFLTTILFTTDTTGWWLKTEIRALPGSGCQLAQGLWVHHAEYLGGERSSCKSTRDDNWTATLGVLPPDADAASATGSPRKRRRGSRKKTKAQVFEELKKILQADKARFVCYVHVIFKCFI